MACAHPRAPTSAPSTAASPPAGDPQKANVAVQHAMLIAIWNMGINGAFYDDPGGDYFTRLNPG